MSTQEYPYRIKCGKADCINTGEKKCGRCKNALYCSRECQVADWKNHKKICTVSEEGTRDLQQQGEKKKAEEKDDSSYSFQSMLNFALKKMMREEISISLSIEYIRNFPNDIRQGEQINIFEFSHCQKLLADKAKIWKLISKDFMLAQYFVQRWGSMILDETRLLSFVQNSSTKFGDIYVRSVHPPYPSFFYQTMRHTSIANQVYEFGHTYVGFGYVDLFQLVWGHFKKSATETLTFYGWDMNRVTVLRSKLIYIIFKYFKESEINTRSALQIWFSSCWDAVTLKAFNRLIKQLMSDAQKYDLCDEDVALLKIWKKNKVTIYAAKQEFYREKSSTEDSQFDDIWRMKSMKDRVMFARYIFTGCIFADEDITVCGNPTMFTPYQGKRKRHEESFFKGIDLHAKAIVNVASGVNKRDSLFDTITFATLEAVLNFRNHVYSEKIVCHLQTKFVDTFDMNFAAEIKSLAPSGIDWSNLPDYMEKNSFVKFARACSVDDTIHYLHFLNWFQYVFGSSYVDYVYNQRECNEMLNDFLDHHMKNAIKVDEHFLEFFSGPAYINPLKGINTVLRMRFRQTFEDFFLSDENGKVLNRYKTNVFDSAVSFFFEFSPTMFQSVFTFNDSVRLDTLVSE